MKVFDSNFNEQNGADFSCDVFVSRFELIKIVTHLKSEKISYFQREISDADLFTFDEELEFLLNNKLELSNNKFKRTSINVHSPFQTVVPSSLFEESQTRNYLEMSCGKLENHFLSSEDILAEDIHFCYGVPRETIDVLAKYFETKSLQNTSTTLLKIALQQNSISPFDIHLHVINKQIDIILLKGNELQFINSFETNNSADVLYHLLNICEQNSVPNEKSVLTIHGGVQKNDELHDLLYDYFKNLRFAKSEMKETALSNINGLESHQISIF